jgi:ribosomal 30S subunit maturation factor RimM
MLSLYFDEDLWQYLVIDNTRNGDASIIAKLNDIETVEAAIKMYEYQIEQARTTLAQNFDAVYSDDDGPSWRTEDVLGGE